MNNNIETKLKGTYHFVLTDSTTGEVKQDEIFHNIPTYGMMQMLHRYSFYEVNPIHLMLGTGTAVPQYSDSGCKNKVLEIDGTRTVSKYINSNTYKLVETFTFPATTSYVANNICEASMVAKIYYSYLGNLYYIPFTRCLFTDSEGNVIKINKTSLDILTVTVDLEISMASSNNNFYLYNNPSVLKKTFDGIYGNRRFDINLIKYKNDKNYIERDYSGSYNVKVGSYLFEDVGKSEESYWNGTANSDGTGSYYRTSSKRIANTEITSETYFKGMSFDSLGCVLIPDETLFPTYTISNIEVGFGDGETTQFNNPLSYFKEGTEVIKVYNPQIEDSETTLVRDVDYTINHISNAKKLLNLCEDFAPTTSVNNLKKDNSIWKSCGYMVTPMFRISSAYKRYISEINTNKDCYGINSSNPVVLDYDSEQSFNFIKGVNLRLMRKQKSNNAYSFTTTTSTIYVDYSQDGEEWNLAGSGAISSNGINISFENTISARYWRLRTNQVDEDSNYYYMISIISSTHNIYTEDCGIALGLCDPYITFTNPPAEGDAIVMSVGMDLMMKNSNYAMDIQPVVNYKISI